MTHVTSIDSIEPPYHPARANNFSNNLQFVRENLSTIVGVTLVFVLMATMYAYIKAPMYQANILIQVEEGPATAKSLLDEQLNTLGSKAKTAAEMEILRSRLVVSKAVDNTALYIDVKPKYYPLIGAWIARGSAKLFPPSPGGYVRGAESARISTFDVPADLEGEPFSLITGSHGHFRLVQADKSVAVDGQLGRLVTFDTPLGKGQILVEEINAMEGAVFHVTRHPRAVTIERLQANLQIEEKGKQSGVIGVTLNGPNPTLTSQTLNEIGSQYIRQNIDKRSEEAENTLTFLDKQLPKLKQALEKSEAEYNSIRSRHGTVDLKEEARTVLQQSILNQTRMAELQQKKEQLLAKYTENHPEVISVKRQLHDVSQEASILESRIQKLPSTERDVVPTTRDVKVNTDLYTSLLNTAEQLRLVKASKTASARIVDTAIRPVLPVQPGKIVILLMATAVGIALGLLCAIFRSRLNQGIRGPGEFEGMLGISSSALVSHSQAQKAFSKASTKNTHGPKLLACRLPMDVAVEGIRTFKSILERALLESRNNIVVVTGPTAKVGKTFILSNLAAVFSLAGKRILVIDGDLRKGHLHQCFGVENHRGLVELILGDETYDKCIHKDVVQNIDFLSAGGKTQTPAELLASARMGELLNHLAPLYDLILIDAAPVLPVSDALGLGNHAGLMINVARANFSTAEEIVDTMRRLQETCDAIIGTLFNDIQPKRIGMRYGTKYGDYINA